MKKLFALLLVLVLAFACATAATAEGEEIKVLTLCNKLTREVRLAKIYIDTNLTEVTASCEFFYSDEASLRLQLEHSLVILGRVRSVFRQALVEFEE